MSVELETRVAEVEDVEEVEEVEDLAAAAPLTNMEASSSTFSSEDMVACRICKGSRGSDLVSSPCNCKGSMGTVHVSCLEEWLTGSIRDSCELCSVPFNVVRTLKYSCFTSALIFLQQHTNGFKLLRDLFFLTVSIMNTSILLFMWASFVSRDFLKVPGGEPMMGKMGTSLVKGVLYLFLFTLCLVFVVVNTIDDFRRVFYFYCLPWYRWWQAAVDVKLIQADTGVNKPKTE